MTDLRSRLIEALGEDRLHDVSSVMPSPGRDICGNDIGEPGLWVRPRSTAEVQSVVQEARRARVPVVPVGKRTAYWRPLSYDGAVALDMSGLDALGETPASQEPLWVGAGVEVRDLHEHLRRSEQCLACHPDAFGDTSIGAMVSTGFAAGCGLGTTGLDGLVAGLVVVLGTGEVLRTGAAHALGCGPFMRMGIPDPTGLFYGADGALGIVTEVAVRPWPAGFLTQMSVDVPRDRAGTESVMALAEALRERGSYETLRCVSVRDQRGESADTQRLDVVIRSSTGGRDMEVRAERVRRSISLMLPGSTVLETQESPKGASVVPRWRGERGEAWEMLSGLRMVGVDVNVSYADADTCLAVGEELLSAAARLPGWISLRRGIYGSPDNVNLGYHCVFGSEGDPGRADLDALLGNAMDALAGESVVPYRWGRDWGVRMESRLDPGYRRLMTTLKAALDPDGILHPGAALWP